MKDHGFEYKLPFYSNVMYWTVQKAFSEFSKHGRDCILMPEDIIRMPDGTVMLQYLDKDQSICSPSGACFHDDDRSFEEMAKDGLLKALKEFYKEMSDGMPKEEDFQIAFSAINLDLFHEGVFNVVKDFNTIGYNDGVDTLKRFSSWESPLLTFKEMVNEETELTTYVFNAVPYGYFQIPLMICLKMKSSYIRCAIAFLEGMSASKLVDEFGKETVDEVMGSPNDPLTSQKNELRRDRFRDIFFEVGGRYECINAEEDEKKQRVMEEARQARIRLMNETMLKIEALTKDDQMTEDLC